jgi:hypothetical protein
VKLYWRFGGTYRLRLQGWRRTVFCFSSCWFLDWLTFRSWRWRYYVPPKCQLTLSVYTELYPRRQTSSRIISVQKSLICHTFSVDYNYVKSLQQFGDGRFVLA